MKPTITGTKRALMCATLLSTALLAACSDNDDPIQSQSIAEFEVEVSNLTLAQPLSPVALFMHNDQWQPFSTGQPASTALEQLAEGGDNSDLINAADASGHVYSHASGAAAIGPGQSETLTLEVNSSQLGTLSLSLVSMLVNTNDAIAALNGQRLESLAIDESRSWRLLTYDSGTEANSETADTIPGPAAAGGLQEGFNAVRDDVRDAVYVHAGVVSQDDGLTTSDLSFTHRWDHPAAQVRITRIR